MSDPKTPTEILEALGKPFPKSALKQRAGGGGKPFTYVETHTVIHRLNSATNGDWTFHVRDTQWRDDLLIVQGELSIPGLGTRSGFGVQKVAANAGEDIVKGASSDALKKCATLFGVALDLYGVDYEDMPQAAPQRAQKPASASKAAATAADALPDRDALMRYLHAKESHAFLHAVANVWNFESLAHMPDEKLRDLCALIDGKAPAERYAKFTAFRQEWESQRAADQVALMPGIDEVPNPERFTR